MNIAGAVIVCALAAIGAPIALFWIGLHFPRKPKDDGGPEGPYPEGQS